jgi:hypothetical protein
MTIDRRPIFTVGMVWFDFAKRLPRSSPRYKGKYDNTFNAFQQASAQQLAAAMAAQQQFNPQQFMAPYHGIGNIFGGLR